MVPIPIRAVVLCWNRLRRETEISEVAMEDDDDDIDQLCILLFLTKRANNSREVFLAQRIEI